MRPARKSDKNQVIKIICESFDKNPHVDFIVKNDKKRNRRMKNMAAYAFENGMRRNAVFLTDDSLGIAIIFNFYKTKNNLKEYLMQAALALNTFTLGRTIMVSNLENKIAGKRPKDVQFLYLWFFGVANEALGSNNARELMRFIFTKSRHEKLPIYLETSIKRNSTIYKWYGFKEYDVLDTGYGFNMWFMNRPFEHTF